ncbi:hypothetical protein P3X46_019829 [Hevea brasiliensis]|uniref:Nuclear pore complex protein Nup85 n=1 Tax=Hevea brasiliensis TaxID=3981 RepID=A0ABQ9LLU9_HEVBR|nr:hypothetical protein P3X46_019829 [Hevea brasiliensis]
MWQIKWKYVMEYSKDISSLLGRPKSPAGPVIEAPKEVLKKVREPTCLKAAWDLMEMFNADKLSQAWLTERLVNWLADYDSLLSFETFGVSRTAGHITGLTMPCFFKF